MRAAEGAGETPRKLKPPRTFMPGHPSLHAWTPDACAHTWEWPRLPGALFSSCPSPSGHVEAPKQVNSIINGRISSMGSSFPDATNCTKVHVTFAISTASQCPVQRCLEHSHCCATITTVCLQNFLAFPETLSPLNTNPTPSLSPRCPTSSFLSLGP